MGVGLSDGRRRTLARLTLLLEDRTLGIEPFDLMDHDGLRLLPQEHGRKDWLSLRLGSMNFAFLCWTTAGMERPCKDDLSCGVRWLMVARFGAALEPGTGRSVSAGSHNCAPCAMAHVTLARGADNFGLRCQLQRDGQSTRHKAR
jgi:hypothetical protein